MTANYLPYEPRQSILLPEAHLAHFISDTAATLDLAAFHARYEQDSPRKQPFHAAMMAKVLLYRLRHARAQLAQDRPQVERGRGLPGAGGRRLPRAPNYPRLPDLPFAGAIGAVGAGRALPHEVGLVTLVRSWWTVPRSVPARAATRP